MKGNKEDLPTIVMIHGYMSGGIQFCKMLPKLRDHYHVRTIDLLGMGASGRPQGIRFTSFDDCIDFFLQTIKQYTDITGIAKDGKKFYLLGHSMGGLIAGHYALQHQDQLEGVILMSAVGVQERPPEMDPERFVADRQSAASRYGARWMQNSWPTFTFTPADFYRMTGYHFAKYMVSRGIMRRIRDSCFVS